MNASETGGKKQEPQIVQKGAFRVAGTRYEGRNEHGEIPTMWDHEFLPRMGELASIQVSQDAYGVTRVLPSFARDGRFEYLAAVEVRSFANLPQGMAGWEVPAQTYAVLAAHDVSGIGPTLDYFYREWLPQLKEFEGTDGPMLEVYTEAFERDQTIYLYFPVRRKPSR